MFSVHKIIVIVIKMELHKITNIIYVLSLMKSFAVGIIILFINKYNLTKKLGLPSDSVHIKYLK